MFFLKREFDGLVDKYGSKVFNLAYRMTGNRQDAEDIMQETFIQVYKNLGNFRGESTIYTWIYRIALNCTFRYSAKAEQAYIEQLEGKIQYFEDRIPSEVRDWFDDPEKAVLMSELTREIREGCQQIVMQKLPEAQRIVFIMRVILDFSYNEISEILGLSKNVIKARLNRARFSLLKHFEEKCEWYLKNEPGPCCKAKIGFALAQDTEVLKRVYENVREYSVDKQGQEFNRKSIDYIYQKFPLLEADYKIAKQRAIASHIKLLK